MTLLRRCLGFHRYAFAIQYNGTPFLGFSYQGPRGENCLVNNNNSDLRGLYSIEGRIRGALTALVNGTQYASETVIPSPEIEMESNSHWEQLQVSSRTDRGVHALHNTFHVDIRSKNNGNQADSDWKESSLVRGLNYYLVRQARSHVQSIQHSTAFHTTSTSSLPLPRHLLYNSEHDIRILSCRRVPSELQLVNKHYNPQDPQDQPTHIDWNARFSATRRTYLYRILVCNPKSHNAVEYGIPFESNTSWKVWDGHEQGGTGGGLNLSAIQEAAAHLTGTRDFSSFRGKHCVRSSPIVTVDDIQIVQHSPTLLPGGGRGDDTTFGMENRNPPQVLSIVISGNAFLYRQVRNMVGCLVEVGRNKLHPKDVLDIVQACDRTQAPAMAPAQGLFLAKVEHGDFIF